MFDGILTKIFGSRNNRLVKAYRRRVAQINKLEPELKKLTDDQLKAKTQEFRDRLQKGETLDDLLPEAFAVVREASTRVLGMRHFDVQMIGGMVLNDGKIAEMSTGEGKTLTATLAVYLNALPGKGVHVVTVNDYLASRDAKWMGQLYEWLGLSVGVILSNEQDPAVKRAAYAADITYGTNNEFGFDYLRDNMEYEPGNRRQRPLNYAIVDEVDSILIDEARTPLIISGPAEDNIELYQAMDQIPALLTRQKGEKEPGDYWVDEKQHQVYLSDQGHETVEKIFTERGLITNGRSLYSPQNIMLMHHLIAALKAHTLFQRDKEYVVQNGEVIIVDEFTGRLMPGRRWSDGIHQAVEAKEHVKVQQETMTMASITFQNYFRMYHKLSGMTGTADTEAYEFQDIYGLETVVIPTNRPMIRVDQQDKVFKTAKEKYDAIVKDVKDCYSRGEPVLVGTTSIENSELLSHLMEKEGIPHNVLNAKQHEREAQIVAEAGRPGAVTIATNMAGRGTDIVLGGSISKVVDTIRHDESLTEEQKKAKIDEEKAAWQKVHEQVVKSGGLRIIGSERHESRRIDNQLRGRSGRQGDPGVTQFYLSLEDDLMRLFGGSKMDSIAHMMEKTNQEDDMPIQAGMVSKSIESAQRQVESMHFAARKNVLEYDDVMNLQRKAIYEERNAILDGKSMTERIPGIIRDAVDAIVGECCPGNSASDDWDVRAIDLWAANMTGCNDFSVAKVDHEDEAENVAEALNDFLTWIYEQKSEQLGHDLMENLSAQVMLRIIDTRWMAHLQEMDYLKTGIGLRAFGQRDPLVEYKNEAYNAFQNLTSSMYDDYLRTLLRLEIAAKPAPEGAPADGGRPAHAALAEQEDPLARKMSYSAPEQALEESSIRGRHAAAARAASGVPAAPPRPVAGKPQTYVKDKEDPYANVGRNDPCPCGSGKKFKKCHGQNL